jgi:HTH-type transcriptional regulator / antitoxin MqsA
MIMSKALCDFCERGNLQPTKIARVFDYKGEPLVVQGYTVLVCDQCGEHVTGVAEARVNERLILEAKRKADNLMSGTQVKALRERLGLSQELASQLFGGGPHAFSKYERGEVAQSTAADRLMRIAEMYPAVLGDLAAIQGVDLPSSVRSYPVPVSGVKIVTITVPMDTRREHISEASMSKQQANTNVWEACAGSC